MQFGDHFYTLEHVKFDKSVLENNQHTKQQTDF